MQKSLTGISKIIDEWEWCQPSGSWQSCELGESVGRTQGRVTSTGGSWKSQTGKVGFRGRWGGESSGGFWAGLREWGAHGARVADTLEMEEDIGKTHVAQRRRPARSMKELGVGNAGNGARRRLGRELHNQGQSQSFVLYMLVKLPALRRPVQHTECSFGKQWFSRLQFG